MSDILISGYYGFKNIGDELILRAIISDLRALKPGVSICVLSATPENTAKEYAVKSVNRWNIFEIIKNVINSKMLLSGGGGLFQDTTGTFSLWYYLFIIYLAKIFGKKVFIYAVGVSEMKKAFNKTLARKVFSTADIITVRTEKDRTILQEYGIKKEIEVTADPVFGLDMNEHVPADNTDKIGIIVRNSKYTAKDIDVFVKLISKFSQTGYRSVIISFHPGEDDNMIAEINSRLAMPVEVAIAENYERLIEIFSELKIVISMRLHGLVVAAKLNIPYIPYSRFDKIDNVLDAMGGRGASCGLSVEGIYENALKKILYSEQENPEIMSVMNQKAKQTAGMLIKLLPEMENKNEKN